MGRGAGEEATQGVKRRQGLGARQLRSLRKMRDEVRISEGADTDPKFAGGQCGIVSECVEAIPGLEYFTYQVGCYITDDDQLIYDHCFCRAPDGTVLDATADQFGEGDDIRLVFRS